MVWLRNIATGAVCAGALALAAFAHAQSIEPLQYIVLPEAPGPGEEVLVEVQGVGSFLGDASVTWTRDGKVVNSGVGLRKYSFTTGELGSRTTVGVTIRSATEGTFSKTFTFSPSLINLLWEADTTVPPFFRAKPLYSGGSPLRVIAFPAVYVDGTRVSPDALSYQWFHNDEPVQEQSGAGRTIFTLVGDMLQNVEAVSVDAYYRQKRVAHGTIAISSTEPQVILYERDSLRGIIYDRALPSDIQLQDKELTLQAVPYYFSSVSARGGTLAYTWALGSEETSGPDSARGILTLRQAGEGSGEAQLSVTLQNYSTDALVQSAVAALRLVFGASSSGLGALFGL